MRLLESPEDKCILFTNTNTNFPVNLMNCDTENEVAWAPEAGGVIVDVVLHILSRDLISKWKHLRRRNVLHDTIKMQMKKAD